MNRDSIEVASYEDAARVMAENRKVDPDKPWRVTWGFGAFEDFAFRFQAQDFCDTLRPEDLPMEPRLVLHWPLPPWEGKP